MEYIVGMVTIEAFGDYCLALYAKHAEWWTLCGGYASYAVMISLFIQAIREKGLAWANSAWDGWSNLATGAVALIALGERPSPKEFIGMLLISAGLFLLGTRGTK